MRAPGGWGGYRQPYRGYGLSSYWISPSFLIDNWGDYGLYQPPVGYSWSRYYDDAVLIDGRGFVYDTVPGIAWSRYDLDEAQGGQLDTYYANSDAYRQGAGAGYDYPLRSGDFVDRGPHRYDREYRDGVGQGYPMPGGPGPVSGDRQPTVVESGPGTVVTTSTVGGAAGGTYVNGFYYPPATVTTVTVASAPVVTTTTEVFEDTVTYTRPVVRKIYRKRVWHRPACYCR